MLRLLLATCAAAQFLAVDYGNEYFKAAVIQPQGRADIVTNLHTKRKTPTAVSFFERDGRAFGDDALPHMGKAPEKVPVFLNSLVGSNATTEELPELFGLSKYYPLELSSSEGSGVKAQIGEKAMPVESLVGHVLSFARRLVDGQKPRDVVLTVSSDASQRARHAWASAARIAGLSPKALVHETAAAAVLRAVDMIGNETALYFNMGGYKTEACVVQFATREAGMVKGKGAPAVDVLGCATEPRLGGHFADLAIVETMLEAAGKENPGVLTSKKALRKLVSQAQKTKLVLSSNREALFKVEALHDDKDFSRNVARTDFEEMLAKKGFFEKIPKVVDRALAAASLSLKEITAVEMLGGGWRVPKVQEVLSEYLKAEKELPLGQHLNGDEAMTLGALAVATNGSATYRHAKVFFQDVFAQSYRVEVYNLTAEGEPEEDTTYVRKVDLKNLQGFKKKVAFPLGSGNVGASIFEDGELVATVVLNTTAQQKKLEEDGWENIRLRLVIGSDALGLVGVREAIATSDTNPKFDAEEKERLANETEAEAAWKKEVEEIKAKDAETWAERVAEDPNATNTTLPKAPKKSEAKKKPKPPEKRVIQKKTWVGYAMTDDEVEEQEKMRKELEQKEADVALVEETANDLEGSLYKITDSLEEGKWDSVTNEEQREELKAAVEERRKFLDEDEDRDLATYKEKKETLQHLLDPILERLEQSEARPETKKYVENVLGKLSEAKAAILEKMPWVNETKVEKAWAKVEDFKEWWEKKDKQQEELAPHDVPAYRTGDVEKKAQKLVEEFDTLRKTKKPKDPEEEKRKKEEKKKKEEEAKKAAKKKKEEKKKKEAEKKEKEKKKDKKAKEEPVMSRSDMEEMLKVYHTEKAKAVEEEDFDTAQSLKEKIAKLTEQLAALPEGEEKAAEEGAGEGKSAADEEL